MSNQKRIGLVIFVFLLILFVSVAFYKKNSLKNNFSITNGYIYDFGNSRYSGNTIFFKYKFSVNNIIYSASSGVSCDRRKKFFFQSWKNGKMVQVVYDIKDPDNSSILLTKENYKKYGLNIPNKYKSEIDYIDSLCCP